MGYYGVVVLIQKIADEEISIEEVFAAKDNFLNDTVLYQFADRLQELTGTS